MPGWEGAIQLLHRVLGMYKKPSPHLNKAVTASYHELPAQVAQASIGCVGSTGRWEAASEGLYRGN